MNRRQSSAPGGAMENGALMSWRIVPAAALAAAEAGLPGSILTISPSFRHESMPDEVAMLLPTNPGPGGLIERLPADPAAVSGAMLGLFLAGPFLNVALESARLRRAGVVWVTNLPSVGQQDEEFARQLPDVGLDFDRELACLDQLRAEGFHTAAVVTDGPAAETAARVGPEVMIVMPRVADFAAGFPSLRQRSTAAQVVAEAARAAGWSGVLLGLGEDREVDSEGIWPGSLDGLVCRPVRTAAEAAPPVLDSARP